MNSIGGFNNQSMSGSNRKQSFKTEGNRKARSPTKALRASQSSGVFDKISLVRSEMES